MLSSTYPSFASAALSNLFSLSSSKLNYCLSTRSNDNLRFYFLSFSISVCNTLILPSRAVTLASIRSIRAYFSDASSAHFYLLLLNSDLKFSTCFSYLLGRAAIRRVAWSLCFQSKLKSCSKRRWSKAPLSVHWTATWRQSSLMVIFNVSS